MKDEIRKGTKIIFLWGKTLLKMVVFNGRVEDKPTQQDILRGIKQKRRIDHDTDTAGGNNRDDGLRG